MTSKAQKGPLRQGLELGAHQASAPQWPLARLVQEVPRALTQMPQQKAPRPLHPNIPVSSQGLLPRCQGLPAHRRCRRDACGMQLMAPHMCITHEQFFLKKHRARTQSTLEGAPGLCMHPLSIRRPSLSCTQAGLLGLLGSTHCPVPWRGDGKRARTC